MSSRDLGAEVAASAMRAQQNADCYFALREVLEAVQAALFQHSTAQELLHRARNRVDELARGLAPSDPLSPVLARSRSLLECLLAGEVCR